MSTSILYLHMRIHFCSLFFFFNDTATTEIYTLSLHDALPISLPGDRVCRADQRQRDPQPRLDGPEGEHVRLPSEMHTVRDRKSTRLNSSHLVISYAVFCLKKKKKTNQLIRK